MVSIPKVVAVLSCGFVLCLGLSRAARADDTKASQSEVRADQTDRGQDGKEVRLHAEHTTQKSGEINQGNHIEATVNDQNHALSIRSASTTDRRNEADRPGSPAVESGQTRPKGQ